MTICYIAVGSNIEPEKNVISALKLLMKKVKVTKSSTFYITQPIGGKDQQPYLNGVWQISCSMEAIELKYNILRSIEKELNRERSSDKYAPRTIDLDLILYNDLVISNDKLVIPDKEIYKRSFIALPLYELDNNLILPDSKKSIKEVIKNFDPSLLIEEKNITNKIKNLINGEDNA